MTTPTTSLLVCYHCCVSGQEADFSPHSITYYDKIDLRRVALRICQACENQYEYTCPTPHCAICRVRFFPLNVKNFCHFHTCRDGFAYCQRCA